MTKTWIIKLVLISLCMLAGCQEQSSNLPNSDNEVDENEQSIEVVSNDNSSQSEDNIIIEQVILPEVVRIMDPRTQEIVRTLTPQELGYDTDLYQSKIEEIARELASWKTNYGSRIHGMDNLD